MKKKKWSFVKDNKKRLGIVAIANLITNLMPGVFNIILFQIVINLTVPVLTGTNIDYNVLKQFCWFYIGAFIIYIILSMWSQTINYIEAYTMSSDLRLKLGDKLRKLSLSFFKQHDPGDVSSRILSDVQKTETIIARILPDMVAAAIAPIILISFLAYINAKLASVVLFTTVFAGIFLFLARKIIGTLGQKHVKTVVDTSSRIREYFLTIKLLKSYNLIGERFEKMDEAMLRLKKASFRAEVWTAIPIQIFLFCLDVGYLLMLLLGVRMCTTGNMPVRDLLSFAVLGYFLYEALKSLGPVLVELRYIKISIKRIAEIFETDEPVYNILRKLPDKNNIQFKNVYFGYGNEDVLRNINCNIPEQSMTALVGMSGSGKTTIASLLARFWDVHSGEITIGGISVTEFEPDRLLSKISMVFQDVYLFNDTVANNIRVGKKKASMEEIKKAARLANCHKFIENLPNGYNTIVSEGGKSLSGGEKQRISIARAILKDAPIVILDEATSSLDPENESDIQKAINNLVREKTIIVIAHQFKAIENADQILVLDKGTIMQRGKHEDLIAKKGLYHKLWKEQQKARGWKMRVDNSN